MRAKRWLVVCALIAVALTWVGRGVVRAEDRRTDKSCLVIMTLNAEFLWDGTEPEEGQVDFAWKHSQTEAEEHMDAVAEIIIASNPDIVNVVEVEGLDALQTFNEKFLSGRGYKAYLVNGTDTYTGQDVGLLTRVDPEDELVRRYAGKGTSGPVQKSVSKNYYAKFTVGDTKLALTGLHFLAIPLSSSRKLQRQAQADAIRALELQLLGQGYQLVVLGDFNDYDGGSDSLDHVASPPITNVLATIRAMDPATTADDLVNCASHVAQSERYTAFYDANRNERVDPPYEHTSIDHILLSPGIASKVELVDMPHNHDPLLVTDHFPVVVRLRLADAPVVPPGVALRISRLLPNPEGDEGINEEAAVRNVGTDVVNLQGWVLRDLTGKTWALDALGDIQPGDEKVIKRDGQSMAMTNKGDTIDLVAPDGTVVHSVTYGAVDEGEVVLPAA